MESIRTFALAVCITAIATSVLSILLPPERNGMRPMIRFAVSVFFLSSVLTAFFSIRDLPEFSFSLEEDTAEATDLQQEADRQLIAITEQNLVDALDAALRAEGVKAENISVKVHITESGGIEINKVILSLPETEWERGKEAVKQALGSGVEIMREEESDGMEKTNRAS